MIPSEDFIVELSTSKVATWFIRRIASKLDPLLFRATGGRLACFGPPAMPMLALTTRGRRSGRPRAVQLACIGHEAHPDVEVPVRDERVAMGLSTTAFRLVNAVPLVCEAPDPGIKTFLDLPMITGCMGTHAIPR